jgi:hypothetical protein
VPSKTADSSASGAEDTANGGSTQKAPSDKSASDGRPERKKPGSGIAYPPYVNAYGGIPKLFAEITAASVPPKFTQDFLESVLGMKSTSHRALIPLLKRLGFLDQANVPTEQYRRIRDKDESRKVMAQQVRTAYADLYRANEYAHKLEKKDLTTKLTSVLGAAADDANIPSVVGTFLELRNLADFEGTPEEGKVQSPREEKRRIEDDGGEDRVVRSPMVSSARPLGISYTINLNLPATTEIEVFNAIFKALKEHILDN